MARLASYQGLRALVTGASSGIGRVLALRLAERGAHVALLARGADALERVATEIAQRGGEALALPCDVADPGAVARAATHAREKLGGVDLLVNNAGYGGHHRFLEWDLDDVENLMRVNYLGAVYCTKALLPQMIERGRGWIVFMSSIVGKIGMPDETAYSATKFAMIGLAEGLGMEVEDAGVHVLSVCPGAVRTPFFRPADLARMAPSAHRAMIEPEAVVDATLHALERGRREITVPRSYAAMNLVRAIAPGFLRWEVKRNTIDAVERARRAGGAEPA
jgi:short-subunit dehydrogenase